jgi:hypothetical protein
MDDEYVKIPPRSRRPMMFHVRSRRKGRICVPDDPDEFYVDDDFRPNWKRARRRYKKLMAQNK